MTFVVMIRTISAEHMAGDCGLHCISVLVVSLKPGKSWEHFGRVSSHNLTNDIPSRGQPFVWRIADTSTENISRMYPHHLSSWNVERVCRPWLRDSTVSLYGLYSWYWLKFLPDSLQGQLSGNVCNKYCQPLVKRKPSVRNSLKNPSPLLLAGEDTLPAPPGKARNTKRSLSQRETMKEGYRKTTSGSNSYRQTTSEYMRQIAT